jgi:NAD(P)-dependent dehydrogenase (short-subunit alcohol dehydrogenase family)
MANPTIYELFDLSGRVALVTGGARNLGLDMAMALADPGCDLAITSRSLKGAHASAREISADTGRRAIGLACDVRLEEQVVATVDAELANFGQVDILVNNAGNVLSTPQNKPLEKRPL